MSQHFVFWNKLITSMSKTKAVFVSLTASALSFVKRLNALLCTMSHKNLTIKQKTQNAHNTNIQQHIINAFQLRTVTSDFNKTKFRM
jgi:hypothetical protein